MPVFVCGGCQESLNRNKVSAHCGGRCRAPFVSCLDCGVHFYGEDFNAHIKCISEQEKYTGKKDKKQDIWVDTVTTALGELQKRPGQVPYLALKSIVDRVGEQVVPKFKKKFTNMCRATSQRLTDATIDEIWSAVEQAKKEQRDAAELKQQSNKRLRLEREAEEEAVAMKANRKLLKRALKASSPQPLGQLALDLFDGDKKQCKATARHFPQDFAVEENDEGKRSIRLVV